MRTVPVDEDDLMIPGASHLAESFLGTVLELERRSGLGLKFDVVDSDGRLRLQAPVRFRNGGRRRPPNVFEVRADPVGSRLNTGWMLAVKEHGPLSRLASLLDGGPGWSRGPGRADAGSEAARARLALIRSSHDLVLLPAVDILVAEVDNGPTCRRPR